MVRVGHGIGACRSPWSIHSSQHQSACNASLTYKKSLKSREKRKIFPIYELIILLHLDR
ncbi:hypothetical protein [Azospirillum palustre]